MWWQFSGDPVGVPVLAFVTTIHCAILLLRKYRSGDRAALAILPSAAFTISPWFLATPAWLVTGLAAHFAWFFACEKLLPPSSLPSRAPGFLTVRVLATFRETDEIRTFRFKRPRSFTFKAGQFLMVRVEIGGAPLVRCYSITSAPSCRDYVEISVRSQGLVSRHLHATLRPKTTIDLRGPGGTFVYPEGSAPLVLIAGGIGITPLLAMVRHGIEAQPQRSITLLLSARTAADVPFAKQLQAYADRHPKFRLVIALSAGTHDPRFLSGRIDTRVIEAVVRPVRQSVYMLCGPLPMIDSMKDALESIGVPSSNIHFEKFATAVAAANSAAEAWITLKQSGNRLRIGSGQTILDACERGGATVPSMCRVGVCGTCRTRLLHGDVAGDFDGLDESDRAEGYILPCVARPLGDCAIEA